MLERAIHKLRSLLEPNADSGETALILSGGGARSAYQAGVLRYIAEAFPEATFPIMTGVSAGAINSALLANHPGALPEATERLTASWRSIKVDDVFESESSFSLLRSLFIRGRDVRSEEDLMFERRGLVDTAPLRDYLSRVLGVDEDGYLKGVTENIAARRLKAYAVVTTAYSTGQTVVWIDGEDIEAWERPNRVSVHTQLKVEHIMASTALPILFPAVRIGDRWYGDGGIRLLAPLSPALHLGADRLLVISTRYDRSRAEADEPAVEGYPPVAQIIGVLMNAIFLDMLDQDALRLERLNALVRELPPRRRRGLRPIRLLVLRPSVDIGRLAGQYDVPLKGALGLVTRGLGTGETRSPDWLSMLLFEAEYVDRLMDIGYLDAQRQRDEIEAFFAEPISEAA